MALGDRAYRLPPGMNPEASRLTSDDHPMLAQTLARELQKTREDRIQRMVKTPAKDYAEYRELTGVIEGLDIAIALASQVDSKLKA